MRHAKHLELLVLLPSGTCLGVGVIVLDGTADVETHERGSELINAPNDLREVNRVWGKGRGRSRDRARVRGGKGRDTFETVVGLVWRKGNGAAIAEAHVHQVVAKGRLHFRGAVIDCEIDPGTVEGSRVGDFEGGKVAGRPVA